MADTDFSSLGSSLHKSIEHLIAEVLTQAQNSEEAALAAMRATLRGALEDIERGNEAYQRAASSLRAALDESGAIPPVAGETPTPSINTETIQPASEDKSEVIAAGEIDVIAHSVTISTASELQSYLRTLPATLGAQTREYVNGELHLKLQTSLPIETQDLLLWLNERGGSISTQTDSVLELSFES